MYKKIKMYVMEISYTHAMHKHIYTQFDILVVIMHLRQFDHLLNDHFLKLLCCCCESERKIVVAAAGMRVGYVYVCRCGS